MSVFSKKVQNANISGGGVYLDLGMHELKIVTWKAITTRKKDVALVVDFEVISSTNTSHLAGSTRNAIFLEAGDQMFDQKVKSLCIAAMGLLPGQDDALIQKEDWDAVLEASVKSPLFVNELLKAEGVSILKKAGKEASRRDPLLLDDPSWVKQNSFIRVDFSAHPATRAKRIPAAKASK